MSEKARARCSAAHSITPALGKWRQEDQASKSRVHSKFEVNLDYAGKQDPDGKQTAQGSRKQSINIHTIEVPKRNEEEEEQKNIY